MNMNIEKIEKAVKLVRKHEPAIDAGSARVVAYLCERSGGLWIDQAAEPAWVFAYFRYHPGHVEAVEKRDWQNLAQYDLSEGPYIYVAYFAMPRRGYRIFRRAMRELNPWAITCHRRNHGFDRFTIVKNPDFREEGKHELRHGAVKPTIQ